MYDSFAFSKKTKKTFLRYFRKVKNVKDMSEKFSINSIFINTFFMKIKNFRIELKSKSFVVKNNDIFYLFFGIQKVKKIAKHLEYLNFFS